ncbi:MAG: hypothetical protein M3373_03115 [Gemmatimonadota bacterium]|nr:hypothetical protein [Gemmatimonadota bacterium]
MHARSIALLAVAAVAAAVITVSGRKRNEASGSAASAPAAPVPALSSVPDSPHHHRAGDSAFASLQERGKRVMGVDLYTSTHRYESFPNGGRIELQRDTEDSAGIATIRTHIRSIAAAFADGDFSATAATHARTVPGTGAMAAKRAAIAYTVRDLPRGAELRITTRDAEALRAVHEFLAFQRDDHRAH